LLFLNRVDEVSFLKFFQIPDPKIDPPPNTHVSRPLALENKPSESCRFDSQVPGSIIV